MNFLENLKLVLSHATLVCLLVFRKAQKVRKLYKDMYSMTNDFYMSLLESVQDYDFSLGIKTQVQL